MQNVKYNKKIQASVLNAIKQFFKILMKIVSRTSNPTNFSFISLYYIETFVTIK